MQLQLVSVMSALLSVAKTIQAGLGVGDDAAEDDADSPDGMGKKGRGVGVGAGAGLVMCGVSRPHPQTMLYTLLQTSMSRTVRKSTR